MVKLDNTFENNIIKIGQNAIENTQIIKESSESDIWFHLAKFPSCHVIISSSEEYPATNIMINYCINLVKQNTKYKKLPRLKVNYTLIKNVICTDVPGKVMIRGKVSSMVI